MHATRLAPPAHVRQEDGSRDVFEEVFRRFDPDSSKGIDFGEFASYFAQHSYNRGALFLAGFPLINFLPRFLLAGLLVFAGRRAARSLTAPQHTPSARTLTLIVRDAAAS